MRILERLEQLYEIGGGRGANRPFGSAAEDEAFDLAAEWMQEAGLEVETDRDGNLFGLGPGEGHTVWTGSHLDSVPEGGRFDGALGVVAGIEAVERAGVGSVVVFRGEEVGCVGSRALVARGEPFPRAFIELHIEQGPVLANADVPLGVVTGIVGYARGELVFEGAAGHAGTTPMDARRDALVAASAAILRIAAVASEIEGAVATVGQVEVEPGGINVIPGRVRISVDARAPDLGRLHRLLAAVSIEAERITEPSHMSPDLREILRDELTSRGLPPLELASGAGHDAGILASAGVPSAMLFVRSLNDGVSHSPDELSSSEDVELATEVLAGALRRAAATA
jgi:allantoate deiminase